MINNRLFYAETILKRLAPDSDPAYRHQGKGEDDMSAHARCLLTHTELTLPVTRGQSALGTWQGLYVKSRKLPITIYGD